MTLRRPSLTRKQVVVATVVALNPVIRLLLLVAFVGKALAPTGLVPGERFLRGQDFIVQVSVKVLESRGCPEDVVVIQVKEVPG